MSEPGSGLFVTRRHALAAAAATAAAVPFVSVPASATPLPSLISVKDFGAVGDGTHDDTSAFLQAVTAAPDGTEVLVPPGRFLVRNLVVDRNVGLKGQGWWTNSQAFFGAHGYGANPAAVLLAGLFWSRTPMVCA